MTYGYWQRKFGGDRSVVGRTITVDGKLRQIIGVMPKQFQFLNWETPALTLPIQFDNFHFVRVYAMRKPLRSALRCESLPGSATIIAMSHA
jgi:hypothetical protein